MNYLAHLYFGRKTDASLVGNLLGDFAKGNEENLHKQFPDAVVEGILMHRKIDKFTDSHKNFLEAKILLSSHLVRYAGVIIDVFFDHFLAKHWDRYSNQPLEDFIENCHQILLDHPEWHSEKLKEKLPLLIDGKVLISYKEKHGIKIAMERIAKRGKYSQHLVEAYADFERNYEEFEKIFLDFFPAVKFYAASLAPSVDLVAEPEELSDDDLILTWRQHAIMMAEKGFRVESLVGHFKTKGVSEEAAELAAKKIMAKILDEQAKRRKLLLIPGYFLLLMAPTLFYLSYLYMGDFHDNLHRYIIGGFMILIVALIILSRAKAVR